MERPSVVDYSKHFEQSGSMRVVATITRVVTTARTSLTMASLPAYCQTPACKLHRFRPAALDSAKKIESVRTLSVVKFCPRSEPYGCAPLCGIRRRSMPPRPRASARPVVRSRLDVAHDAIPPTSGTNARSSSSNPRWLWLSLPAGPRSEAGPRRYRLYGRLTPTYSAILPTRSAPSLRIQAISAVNDVSLPNHPF
jgi:hypothetical protein